MGKPRGGQKKHWAESARVEAWYAEIKRRCGWSDYALNDQFAWREGDRGNHTIDTRPKTFEWIRKTSRKPRGLDSRWRNMDELVIAVDSHPYFTGTRALYEADIWNFLQVTTITPSAVQDHIDHLLTTNKLVRVPAEKISTNSDALINMFGRPSLFDNCLQLSLKRMDLFSRIALVWLLHVQTEPPHNASFRAIVESIADELLDRFFARHLPDKHLNYYSNAIGILLQTRLDLSERNIGGYGFIETIGTRPIIPEELLGKLTKEHLAPSVYFLAEYPDETNEV